MIILDTLHEMAIVLYQAGAMDANTMRGFDALQLPSFKHHSAGQIRKLRLCHQASQVVFAAHLNIGSSTVQTWDRVRNTA